MLASRIRVAAIAVLLSLGAGALLFGEGAQAPSTSGKKVNINTASSAELAYLPRIGTKVAERIVERRKEKPFARPEELMEVKGIGEKLYASLKPYVSVSGPTTIHAKVRLSTSSRRPAPSASSEKPSSGQSLV